MTTFDDLDLIEPIRRAIAEQNYTEPTPIQAKAIPPLLEGKDVLGCAQTGTGKTAAFSLPVIQHIAKNKSGSGKTKIRALVLSPTRELAAQIGENVGAYSRYLPIEHIVIFGGVKENPQIAALRKGLDILVATPGRLLDLMGRGFVDLSHVEFFILDEADRMLDMGFIRDIRKVLAHLPDRRQNLLFSATMPPSIVKLASDFLDAPVRVEVTPEATTVELIEQSVMFVERSDKRRLLADLIFDFEVERGIVFTRTKHGANRLCKQLDREGIKAAPIHGNKSQNARRRALDGFKSGEIPILVATDIAARGIDVDDVTHVFNFDLPNEPEVYVHRIGRTGRAGKGGIAIAFCDETEGDYLRDIERLISMSIPVDDDHKYHSVAAIPPPLGASKGRRTTKRRPPRRDNDRPPRQPRPQRKPNNPRNNEARAEDAPKKAEGEQGEGQKKRRRRRRRRPAAGVPTDASGQSVRKPADKPQTESRAGQEGGDAPAKKRRRRRRRRGPRPEGSQNNPS